MAFTSPGSRLPIVQQLSRTISDVQAGLHQARARATNPGQLQETVAESVSYITLAHFGLDSGERSFPYIATWSGDQKLLSQALGTIQKVSAIIIDRVEGHSGEEQPSSASYSDS